MPWEFWELTPAELNIIIEVYTDKNKQDFKESITVAYYNAYFQRVKKMPDLEAFLEKLDGKEEMSDEQMFRAIKKMCKEMGQN